MAIQTRNASKMIHNGEILRRFCSTSATEATVKLCPEHYQKAQDPCEDFLEFLLWYSGITRSPSGLPKDARPRLRWCNGFGREDGTTNGTAGFVLTNKKKR